ncbi:MAG TPA: serine hydrolase domain-containing protein [Actinomycetota bacterium]|jgi:CubicO group peptidase (beta-lactamase class C family)|nr:serine hydrolase domain-containing protein [Actinomycetota bacterium]
MKEAKLPEGFDGYCDDRFAEVPRLLAQQVANGDHHGVSFAAYLRGEPVIDVWGGSRSSPSGDIPWERDTMAICWSTTKGVVATALHMAMERNGVDYDAPVASVWPEFGSNGKDGIKIRHILSHEAGVPQIRDQIADARETGDWEHMVGVMEGLEPLWEPGTANGYHALNYGWLVGEALRRIDGRDVPTFLAEELAGPLGLDGLYIGTPPSEHHRIAPLLRSSEGLSGGPDPEATYDAMLPKDSVPWKALGPRGDLFAFLDSPDGWSSCIPAISGVFTARSLAKLYAAWERDGEVDGVRILSPDTIAKATTVQNDRNDLVIVIPPRWRLGFMSSGSIPVMGPNPEGYGHVGLGGTYACADPKAQVSFALVYDKFGETELLGAARGASVANATVAAAEAAQ